MLVWLSIITWAIHAVESQSYSSRPRPYHFEYEVADDKSGDYHGHRETQNHDGSVTGSYFLLSPDGLWRETQYSDQGYGFKAVTNTFPPSSPPKHRKGSTFSVFQTSGSDFETFPNDLIGRPVTGGNFDSNFRNTNVPPVPALGQDTAAPFGGNRFFSNQNGGLPPPILGQNVGVGFPGAPPSIDFPGSPNFPIKNDATPSLLGQDVNIGVGLPNPQISATGSLGPPQLPLQSRPDFFSNQGFGVKLPTPNIPSVDNSKNQFLSGPEETFNKGPTKFNEIGQINAGAGIGDNEADLFSQFPTGGGEPQATIPGLPLPPSNIGAPDSPINLSEGFGDIPNPGLQPQSFGVGRPPSNQPPFNTGDPQAGGGLENGFPPGQFFNSGNFENVGRPLSDTSSQLPLSNGNPQNTFFTGNRPDQQQGQQFGNQDIFSENGNFGPPNQSGFAQNIPPNGNSIHQTLTPGIGLSDTRNQSPVNENVNDALFFSSPPSGVRQQGPLLNGNKFGSDGNIDGHFGPLGPSGAPEAAVSPDGNLGFGLGPGGNFGTNGGGAFRPDSGQPGNFEPGTGFRGDLRPDSLLAGDFDPSFAPGGSFGPGTGPGANLGPGTGVRGGSFGPGTGPGANLGPGTGVRGDFDPSLSPQENFGPRFPQTDNFGPGTGGNLNRPNFDSGANFNPSFSAGNDFGPGSPQSGNIGFDSNPSGNFGGSVPVGNIDPGSGSGSGFNPGSNFQPGSGLDGNLGPDPFSSHGSGPISGPRSSSRPDFGAEDNFRNNFGGNSNLDNNLGADIGLSHDPLGVGLNADPNHANSIQSAPERFRVQSGIPSQGGIALDDPRVGPQLPLRSHSSQNFRTSPSRKRSPSKRKVTRGVGLKLNSDVLKDLDDNPRNLPQGSIDILKNLQKSQFNTPRAATSGKSKSRRTNKGSKVKVREVKVISDHRSNFTKGFSNFS